MHYYCEKCKENKHLLEELRKMLDKTPKQFNNITKDLIRKYDADPKNMSIGKWLATEDEDDIRKDG